MAQGISDQTLRDIHLTLLNEGCEASGFHGCLNPASPLTRLTSVEFDTTLRLLFGLSAAGQPDFQDVHTNYCGAAERAKRILLTDCPTNSGEFAHADSTAHLAYCGQTSQRHDALEVSLLEMLKKAQYGWF